MVTICLQCGDKGFSNAFVYCVKCLEFAVHRYCLDELPDTFDEFVYWVCDDCEVELPQQFNLLNSEPILLEHGDCINSKHVEPSFEEKSKGTGHVVRDAAENIFEDVPSVQLYKVHPEIKVTESALSAGDSLPLEAKKRARDGACPIAKTKEQTSPRSFSLEPDDMNNDIGSQHHQSLDDDDVLLRKMKTKKKIKDSARRFSSKIFMRRLEYSPREQPCQAYMVNNLNDHDNSAKLESKQASSLEAENKKHKKENKESARNFSLSENSVERIGYSLSWRPCESYTENNLNEREESTELEKEKASVSDAKMECSGHQSCVVNTELKVTVTGNQVVEFSPLNKTNKKKRVVNTLSTDLQGLTPPEKPRFGPGHLSDDAINNYELAQPLADPIWRGSFNILNKEYDAFEGMVAHLSKKACQKAYEEAHSFPTLLDLEMHPKLDVWPKSFERSEPSDDSIALYFFPEHKRYERMFDHLVEQMLNYELAMRAILENAELLVFTSTELPMNYWRFRGKYYLWGVFRGKQPPSAQPSSNNNGGVKEDSKHTKRKSCDGRSRPSSP